VYDLKEVGPAPGEPRDELTRGPLGMSGVNWYITKQLLKVSAFQALFAIPVGVFVMRQWPHRRDLPVVSMTAVSFTVLAAMMMANDGEEDRIRHVVMRDRAQRIAQDQPRLS